MCECDPRPLECGGCGDSDECTDDDCDQSRGECTHTLKTGYDGILCRLVSPVVCIGERIPTGIVSRQQRAYRWIEKAKELDGTKPRRVHRLRKRAGRLLRRAASLATRAAAARRPKLAKECAEALADNFLVAGDGLHTP
jgi:hypothetical protein